MAGREISNVIALRLDPWKREAAKVTRLRGGAYNVEPMRFLTLAAAKKEARITRPRKVYEHKRTWQDQARHASQCLCRAIQRAGVRP